MSFTVFTSAPIRGATNSASGFSEVMTGPNIIFFIGFVAVLCLYAWFCMRQRRQREEWAKSHGFRYIDSDTALGKATGRVYGLGGHGHVARAVIAMPLSCGEAFYYKAVWEEGYGENKTTYRDTFLCYPLPVVLPRMHIKPEGLFGLANNDFNTEWQEFNKKFDIKTENEQATHALLTGPMQEFMMNRLRGIHMEFIGDKVFLRLSQQNYKLEDSIVYVALMNEWLAKVPGFFFGYK